MLRFGTEFAVLIRDEIQHSLKQTHTRFCGRLRANACIQPQCRCRSPSSSAVHCQRSGRWHDSNVARDGSRRARFGATLPVEVTLAFKLGIKVVIQTNGYLYSIPNTARTGHAGYWPPKYTGEHWPARIALTHSLLSDSLNGIER